MDEQKKKAGRPTIYDGRQRERDPQSGRMRTVRPANEKKETEGAIKGNIAPVRPSRAGGPPVKREQKASEAGNREGNAAVRPRRESIAPVQGKRRREQENEAKMQSLKIVLGVLVVLLIVALIYDVILGHGVKQTGAERMAEKAQKKQEMRSGAVVETEEEVVILGNNGAAGETAGTEGMTEASGESETAGTEAEGAQNDAVISASGSLLEQAEFKAMQYDYDGAIALLEKAEGFAENAEYQAAVAGFQAAKDACVPYPAEEITHVFFHTLIHDASRAFDGDEYEDGYNQFMVTEYEFNSIIQQMYDRGYVMVFLPDFAPAVDDGTGTISYQAQDIMLPPGKIPFVLSQDDVSYYHYMDGDGYASRLIVDENGDVKNEYIEDDGSISVGDYDMVPLIDRFVEKHPDFSYRGAKGYIALTGYEGILGYRTDEVYKTKQADRITVQQQQFFDSYPGGFDEAAFEKECEGARKVAEAMKANGWKFASHTWGHQNLHETNGISYERFVRDTDRWETWVEPLIGETDTLIYAFGGDIQGWEPYSGDRFNYLKEAGFEYYCGVDSSKYAVQIGANYVRQSRRNIDGYRMYYNPEMLSDLFDVSQAWDPLRPEYVPPIS